MSSARRGKLAAVPSSDAPLDMAKDIYAADRKKMAEIDWAAVHIRGDRAAAISLPERIRSFLRR
jgi:hypothetical protein